MSFFLFILKITIQGDIAVPEMENKPYPIRF